MRGRDRSTKLMITLMVILLLAVLFRITSATIERQQYRDDLLEQCAH